MNIFRWITVLALMAVTGCATRIPEQVLSIRSLSQGVPLAESKPGGTGNFEGIERLARDADGKILINVLLVHGIGWTQQAAMKQTGFDFIDTLEAAYGVRPGTFTSGIARLCSQSSDKVMDPSRYQVGGLRIRSSVQPIRFYTDDPLSPVVSSELACMDRIDISLGDRGMVHLYRLLWDDAFYNTFQYPHLGYDDGVFGGHERAASGYGGYENIDGLRLRLNRDYKTSLITYGLSDAAMYIGPAGRLLRDAVRGGLCAVINDATGQTREFADIWSSSQPVAMREVQVKTLCETNGEIRRSPPLVVIAESLGSRIVFDVLARMRTEARLDGNGSWDAILPQKLAQMGGKALEVYLMANQIPLIANGAVSSTGPTSPPNAVNKALRFIAFSEINDLLTYELVPYFEHLAYLRCWGMEAMPEAYPDCADAGANKSTVELVRRLKPSSEQRQKLVKELGFDVVDVRLQFAQRTNPLVSDLADPIEAHTGHLRHKLVRDLLLCGSEQGAVNRHDCGAQ